MDARHRLVVRPEHARSSLPTRLRSVRSGAPAEWMANSPHLSSVLALQKTFGNRATTAMIARMAEAQANHLQREDGDEEEQGPADPESWVDWAYRNKWKIAGGVAVTAGVATLAYWYFKSSNEDVPSNADIGQATPTPTIESPTLSGPSGGPSALPTPTPSLPTPSLPTPTPSLPTQVLPTPLPSGGGGHAWPQGQAYTPLDKLEGLVGLVPGGGPAIQAVKTLIDPSDANSEALIAEVAKLASGPFGVAANVWDNVAKVLSYYSSGKIEIGTTIDLLQKAGEGMQSAEASGMLPAMMGLGD